MQHSSRGKSPPSCSRSKLTRIDFVDSRIKRGLREQERLGEEGEMEEVQRKQMELRRLYKEKEDLLLVAMNPNLTSRQLKVR